VSETKFGTYGPCYGKPAQWFDDPMVGPVNIAYEPEALSRDGVKKIVEALINAQSMLRERDNHIERVEQSLRQLQARYVLLKQQSFLYRVMKLVRGKG